MNDNKPQVDHARRALLKALGVTGMAIAVDRLLLPRWQTPQAGADSLLKNGGSKDGAAHSVGGPTEQLGSESLLGSDLPGFDDGPNDLLSDSGGFLSEDVAPGQDIQRDAFDNDSFFDNGSQDIFGDGIDSDTLRSAADSEDSLFDPVEHDILSAGGCNDICIGDNSHH